MAPIARRIADLRQSAIRTMTARCEEVGGINLGQGLCQIDPPPALLQEATARFPVVSHSYSRAEGDCGLLDALADKLRSHNGILVDPATQIVVTIGASGAFNATLLALLDPGDGVLILEPYYGYHLSAIQLFNLEPQPVRLAAPDFRLDPDVLRSAVTRRTRAIVICTPGNPSGRRFTQEELAAVAAVAHERDLLVITDETYEHIYYSPERHLSPAAVDGLAERTITITSLSKSYSIPGWRLGYLTGPASIVQAVRRVADILSVCAPTPLQQLARRALALPDSYYTDLRAMYDGKRHRLMAAFDAAGLPVRAPEGAYYLFVDCSPLGVRDGWAAAEHLLHQGRIATIPGEAFYLTDPDAPYVRVCFSLRDEVLDRAAGQIQEAAARSITEASDEAAPASGRCGPRTRVHVTRGLGSSRTTPCGVPERGTRR
jgi:aminotransferase